MKTISIIGQKGGAGKSTIAINLAGAATAYGLQPVIIDLDPQASAKSWHDHRRKESPVVISAQAARLAEVRTTAEAHGADLCIIDTAPHSETSALAAARAADLVLIPCRAAFLDLKAMETTVDLVRLAKQPAMFLLNAIRPGDKSLPDEAAAFLAGQGIPVCPLRISQRAAFGHAITAGKTVLEYEPEGAAATEIKNLFMLACNHVGMMTPADDKREVISA